MMRDAVYHVARGAVDAPVRGVVGAVVRNAADVGSARWHAPRISPSETVRRAVHTPVGDAVSATLAVRDALQTVGDVVWRAVDDAVWRSVGDTVRYAPDGVVFGAVLDPVGAVVRDALRSEAQ